MCLSFSLLPRSRMTAAVSCPHSWRKPVTNGREAEAERCFRFYTSLSLSLSLSPIHPDAQRTNTHVCACLYFCKEFPRPSSSSAACPIFIKTLLSGGVMCTTYDANALNIPFFNIALSSPISLCKANSNRQRSRARTPSYNMCSPFPTLG